MSNCLQPMPPRRAVRIRCTLCGDRIDSMPGECCELPRDFALEGEPEDPNRLNARVFAEIYS